MQSHRYGKMESRMNTAHETIHPLPPNILRALRSGFDAISNHVTIILLPVLLDLWLWLGPHLQIKTMMADFVAAMKTTSEMGAISGASNTIPIDYSVITEVVERINLMSFLRSYPVGIPSLVAGILPVDVPAGSPWLVDIASPVLVILLSLGLTLLGTLVGSYYFVVVSQAALDGRVMWKVAWNEWRRVALNATGLMLALLVLLLILLVPASCILSVISMGGIPVSQIAVIVLSGMLLWVLFPLVFTPMGIFALRLNLIVAVQRSILITRITLPNTVLFFVVVFITSQGLDFLWRVPQENSWFTLVGLAGHGFVASSLLAAAMVYYRDADAWAQKIFQGMRRSQSV